MKCFKFIIVLFVFAGLASCSSDDEVPDGPDPIVGKWKLEGSTLDGEEIEISGCQLQSTIEFFTNGNVTFIDFYEDFETEECVSESATEKWQNRGNNLYRFTEGNQFTDLKIVFSNNNNTFKIIIEDQEGSSSSTYVRV